MFNSKLKKRIADLEEIVLNLEMIVVKMLERELEREEKKLSTKLTKK